MEFIIYPEHSVRNGNPACLAIFIIEEISLVCTQKNKDKKKG